jgi:subtilase family serine protease
MRKLKFLPLSALALAFAFNPNPAIGAETTSGGNHSRALITQPIDEANRVTLGGNTRPEASAENDRGPVASDFAINHMFLQLRRSPEQEAAARQLIEELHNPHSPNYHQWLTARQFGDRFGLAQADLDTITRWLESYGFKVNMVYTSRMTIDFSGTAGQVHQAFQTEIHNLEVKGQSHIANMGDPRIPAALAPAVEGIVSLHNFKPQAMHTPKANYTFDSGGFQEEAVVPADLATIYNLNPLFEKGITGGGQTIVVVEDTNFQGADWNGFRRVFGLRKYMGGSLLMVNPTASGNNCSDPGRNGDDIEAAVDAEWASAAAPDATIELASCEDTTTNFGGLIAIQNLLNSTTPPAIISMSYGECEALTGATLNAMFNSAFQQAVTEGTSVFVSAGDANAAGCDRGAADATHGIGISGWGETPYNVAVGGTDFGDTYAGTVNDYWSATNSKFYGSALSYVPEIPWNDSCASILIANFVTGSPVTYGSTGFCNTTTGEEFLDIIGGSGGPSACATGVPSIAGVVSGTCAGYPKPSWQAGVLGIANDGVRDIPDVSLLAANGLWGHYYIFCDSNVGVGGSPCGGAPDTWSGAGGTSFSSPILAGIQALVNQKTGSSQGNPNYVYYQLAANEYGSAGNANCNSTLGNGVAKSCVFYDVTLGDIDVDCMGTIDCYLPSGTNGVLSTSDSFYLPAYATTTGWDFATGLGTINANNLVEAWKTVAP